MEHGEHLTVVCRGLHGGFLHIYGHTTPAPLIAAKYILANFVCTRETDCQSVIRSKFSKKTAFQITNEQTVCESFDSI